MGQAASSGTKKLPTANDVSALGGKASGATTPNQPKHPPVSEGTVQQLRAALATYKVTKELNQRSPTLGQRLKQLAMDDDAYAAGRRDLLLGESDKMKVLTDEPMRACVDVFDDAPRVSASCRRRIPQLGRRCLDYDKRDASGVISLRGGDELAGMLLPADLIARAQEIGCRLALQPL